MRILGVILLATFFAACSKTSNPVSSPSGDVKFSSQVQPILTANCALSGCHAGQITMPVAINEILLAGQAYNNIVSVKSQEMPNYFRVKPSSSDSSYLYMKITGDSRIGSTARMPYGKAPLSSSDIQTIKSWIDQGAQNN